MKNFINKLIQFFQSNRFILIKVGKYMLIIATTAIIVKILCNAPHPGPVIDRKLEEVKTLQDRNGKLVAIIEQNELDKKTNQAYIDSLAYALKLKPKFIKGVDREVTKIDTIWRDSVVYIPGSTEKDSTTIYYRDRHVNILAVGKRTERDSYIKFGLTPDTATRVTVYKNPLFGRPIEQKYTIHTNPYFITTHGDSYQEKQRRAVLNISISGGYDFFNKKWFGGPTVGVPIKTFYSKK